MIKTTVTVRYVGMSSVYSGVREEQLELEGRVTVRDILNVISGKRGLIFSEGSWLVLVNGNGVPASQWPEYRTNIDVELSILPMLSGG